MLGGSDVVEDIFNNKGSICFCLGGGVRVRAAREELAKQQNVV